MTTGYAASVSVDDVTTFALGAPTTASGTVTYGAYTLNEPATASTSDALVAAMPAALVGTPDCESVHAVSAAVFTCTERLRAPYVSSFAGTATTALKCTVPRAAPSAFNCSSEALAVAASFAAAQWAGATVTLSFTVDASVAVAVVDASVVFALARARALAGVVIASDVIVKSNDARAKETRVAVAFIFLFVAIGMTAAAGVLAIWLGWLLPLAGQASEGVYFAICLVLIHGISWAGGLAGWIAILSITAFALVALPVVYLVIRTCHKRVLRRNAREKAADPSAEQQESGDGDTSTGADSSTVDATADDDDDDDDDEPTADALPSELPNEPRAFAFTKQPYKLGRKQAWVLFAAALTVFASAVACIVIFYAWGIDSYFILDRETGAVVDEFQPKQVAKAIGVLYGYDRWASIMRVDWLLQAQTKACGVIFKKTLTTDAEKLARIQKPFIEQYSIDMSLFARTDYRQYTSVNDWFTRALAPGVRPVADPSDSSAVLSVADCRLVVYQNIDSQLSIWLKGQSFTVADMLKYASVAEPFIGGTIAIFRLAPADYHLTHSPMDGVISNQYFVKSTIYSVGADAMRSNSGAIYNTRMVSIIESTSVPARKVAFVAIGATCVGSVFMTKGNGASVAKGESIQGFAFGGSTVVLLFPPNTVQFDADIVANSAMAVETYVKVNTRMGTWLV